jgi:ABC-type ATPase with predicted acetyltransferase domain
MPYICANALWGELETLHACSLEKMAAIWYCETCFIFPLAQNMLRPICTSYLPASDQALKQTSYSMHACSSAAH